MKLPVFNVNSFDPDQTSRSSASDLGLLCLPITSFGVSRPNWVNPPSTYGLHIFML